MQKIFQAIHESTGMSLLTTERLFSSLLILLVFLTLRFFAMRTVNKWADDAKKKYIWRRTINYVTTVFIILLIGRIWFRGFQALVSILGIASAGLLIALQETVQNIAGWIFILTRAPFKVGDRIEIGGIKGDVIDVRLFQFSLMEVGNWVDAEQSTGRIVHVPNGKVFRDAISNYTTGFEYIWHELPVLITYESNWEDAKKILEAISRENSESVSNDAERDFKKATEKYMISFKNLTPAVYTSVQKSGILLTIRYLTHPRKRRDTEQAMWESILREFAKRKDIDFAYPTTRIFNNPIEGKPAAFHEESGKELK
jgi:small-conductance mechanosensitive channel